MLTKNTFKDALKELGLEKGDTVFVQSDLFRIGLVENTKTPLEICDFYYDNLMEYLGEKGTICVLTFFGDYGKKGIEFDRASSPSLSGLFSEYIRSKRESIRSEHPIYSITSIGENAEHISGGNHLDGFGWDSPWGRLHRINSKIMNLGYGIRADGFTFMHYIENMFGVPYQYNKPYNIKTFNNGIEVKKLYTLSVRYLDYDIEYDYKYVKDKLIKENIIKNINLGSAEALLCDSCTVFEEVCKILSINRYALLEKKPNFIIGKIPFDSMQMSE
tara:strand:- start:224 stop:1045 length:822 start_codon:yes stop_codon:yes gene_type:complete